MIFRSIQSLRDGEDPESMKGQEKERWLQLCQLAANEQDHEKLIALVKEITQLLEDKERRVRGEAPQTPA